jgi:outer membrane beta-barrel protein
MGGLMKLKILVVGSFLLAGTLFGAVPEPGKNLEEELGALGTPGNQAPAGVSSEQLYSVQNRFSPLRRRHELALGAGNNFSADSFQISRNLDASYRFYLSNRLFLGLSGSLVFNQLTNGGDFVFNTVKRPPDLAVTFYRSDLLLGYHLFYGKFRVSMDSVFYFDHYVAVGPGLVGLEYGMRFGPVLDTGIVAWFNRSFSVRIGVKDYIFNEPKRVSEGLVNNFVGYLQAGFVFGG